MSKRIRELAEQAGYKPLSPPTFADELNEIFMRKFAELIVRECITVVGECNLVDDDPIANIKQHFGVK